MSYGLGSAHGIIEIDYQSAGVQQAITDLNTLAKLDVGRSLTEVGGTLQNLGQAMLAPIEQGIGLAADFEQQMSFVSSALGIIPSQGGKAAQTFDDLSGKALQIGKDTAFGAVEAGSAMEELAKLGVSADDILSGAADATVNLASAIGESLPTSASAVGAALNAFGLDASNAADIADTFTAAINGSATNLTDFMGGFRNLAPVMAGIGGTFEETAAAVGYFTNFGLKGADVGVSLARALENLVTPTDEAAALMQQLGIAAFDAQGEFVGFPALMDQLQSSMAGMTDEQRQLALATLFGAEAVDVMNIATQQGGDGLRDFTADVEPAGQAAASAAARLDNLRGAQEELAGSTETASIILGQTLIPAIEGMVEGLTGLVDMFNSADPAVQSFVATFGALGGVLLTGAGGLLVAAGRVAQLSQALTAAGVPLGKLTLGLGLLGVALGVGIAAYQSNFLGFADTINTALADAGKALYVFDRQFASRFGRNQYVGMNRLAAATEAFGYALEKAVGIDVTDQLTQLATAIDAVDDAFWSATENGLNPLAAALEGLAAGADALGFDGIADAFDLAADKVQTFGETFREVEGLLLDEGFNQAASSIAAFGAALDAALGTDVAPWFNSAAEAVQAFSDAWESAIARGVNPMQAAMEGLRAALESLTGFDLSGISDALGAVAGALQDITTALSEGDFSGAADALGNALQRLSDFAGEKLQALSDTIATTLSSIDVGEVLVNIGTWAAGTVDDIKAWAEGQFGVDLDSIDVGEVAVNIAGWIVNSAQSIADAVLDFVGMGGYAGAGGPRDAGPSAGTIPLGEIAVQIGGWLVSAASSIWDAISAFVTGGGYAGEGGPRDAGPSGDQVTLSSVLVGIGSWAMGELADMGPLWEQVKTSLGEALSAAAIKIDQFADWTLEVAAPAAGAALAAGADLIAAFDTALVDAAIAIDSFTGWGLTVATPEGGVEIDGEGIKSSIGSALQNLLTVDQGFVDQAKSIGEQLGTMAGQAIAAGLSAAINDMLASGTAPGQGSQAHGADASGLGAPTLGDAFAGFGESFFEAARVAIEPQFEIAKQLLLQWAEEQKTDLWNDVWTALLGDPISGQPTGASKTAAEASGNLLDGVAGGIGRLLDDTPNNVFGDDALAGAEELSGQADTLGEVFGQQMAAIFGSPEFAAGMESGLATVPAASFTSMAQGFLTKLQESMGRALTQEQLSGEEIAGDAVAGPGMAQSLVTSLVNGITQGMAAVDAALFAGVGTALLGKIQEGIGLALSAGANSMGGPGERGEAGTASGLGTSLVTSLAQNLATAITGAPPESFAAVGLALQAKLQEALSMAMSQAGAAPAGGRPGGAAGATGGGGIGEAIATMIVSSIAGADFGAVGEALNTAITTPLQQLGTELGTTLTTAVQTAVSAATTAAQGAIAIGQTILSQAMAGIGGGGAAPAGGRPGGAAGATGGGGLDGAVVGMVTAAISAGTSAAQGGTEIGSTLTSAAASGVGGGAAPAGGRPGGAAGATGGSFDGSVEAMVRAGIAAGVGVANAEAGQIGAAVSAGAAAGVILDAMNGAVADMVSNGIAAGMAAADAHSPSRVAETELGEPIGQGAALGVTTTSPQFEEAVAEMIQAGIDTAADGQDRMLHIFEDGSSEWMTAAEAADWYGPLEDDTAAVEDAMGGMMTTTIDTLEAGLDYARELFGQYGLTFGNEVDSARQGIENDSAAWQAAGGALGTAAGSALTDGFGNAINLDPAALGIPEVGHAQAQSIIDSVMSRVNAQEQVRQHAAGQTVQDYASMVSDLSRSQTVRTQGKVMMGRKEMGDFAIETTIGAMLQVPQRGARRNGLRVV